MVLKNKNGEVLFACCACGYNTIEETLVEACKQHIPLTGLDLRGRIIEDIKICGYSFTDVDFSTAYIKNVVFDNCEFHNVRFDEASLINTTFTDSMLTDSTFLYATMLGATFYNVLCKDVNMTYAKMFNNAMETFHCTDCDFDRMSIVKTTFKNSSFSYSNFGRTLMKKVNFSYCSFHGINFRYAQLQYMSYVDNKYEYTDFDHVSILEWSDYPDLPMACPTTGAFICWKKICEITDDSRNVQYVVKMEVPEDAERSSGLSNTCRCSKAKVLDIINIETTEHVKSVLHRPLIGKNTEYVCGEMVYPDSYDENRWNECSNGIHFFMKMSEAIDFEK